MEIKKIREIEIRKTEIKLTYESLIALLQGKEFHLMSDGEHFIFLPPFDGGFLTHEEIRRIRSESYGSGFEAFWKIIKYVEDRDRAKNDNQKR